jgi:hypothetical protein
MDARRFVRAVFLPFILMGCVVAPAAAQEETGEVSAQCCICADFYVIGTASFDSFNHDHIGVCGECCAMYEDLYGSLDEAVTSIKDQIHDLGAKGRQLHSGMATAVQDWDNEWNEFWGTNDEQAWRGGTAVGFATALFSVATLTGTGKVVKAANYVNSGTQLVNAPTDWTNFTSLGIDLYSDVELQRWILDRQYLALLEDEWRIYRQTGNAQEYIRFLNTQRDRYQRMAPPEAQGKLLSKLGPAVDFINFAMATNSLYDNIGEWIIARREALRLKAEIEAIEAQIEALTRERQCLEAELEYRRSGGGGGGGGDGGHDPTRMAGADRFEWALHPSVDAAPEQDAEDAVDFGPMPEPDPTQPDEIVMLRLQQSLEALAVTFKEADEAFCSVLPLIVTLRTVELIEEDGARVAAICGEMLPYATTCEEKTAEIVRNSRSLLQQFHDSTQYLYEEQANLDRFKLGSAELKFHLADWVPPYDTFGWRGLAPAGAGYAGRIDVESVDDLRLVPPGIYDVLWAQYVDQWQKPTVLATLDIKKGDTVQFNVNTGAKIAAADWVPAIDDGWGWWGAAPSGATFARDGGKLVRVNWVSSSDVPIVLAAGEYDILWAQGFSQRDNPVVIASGLSIQAGELAAVPVNSGIRLTAAPEMDSYGWWAVVPPGGTGDGDWINISRGSADQPLVVAPGTYDVLFNAGLSSETVRIAENLTVRAGQLLELPAR